LISAKTWRSVPKEVKNPCVRQALDMARMDNLSHKESELMSRRQLYQWDPINMRTYALEEDRAEGKVEGKVEGKAEGKAETLQTILIKRLGPLPKTVTTQIGRLDFLQLEKLEDRVLDLPSVKSLREFMQSL
jgi:predicted transposase YdaD